MYKYIIYNKLYIYYLRAAEMPGALTLSQALSQVLTCIYPSFLTQSLPGVTLRLPHFTD